MPTMDDGSDGHRQMSRRAVLSATAGVSVAGAGAKPGAAAETGREEIPDQDPPYGMVIQESMELPIHSPRALTWDGDAFYVGAQEPGSNDEDNIYRIRMDGTVETTWAVNDFPEGMAWGDGTLYIAADNIKGGLWESEHHYRIEAYDPSTETVVRERDFDQTDLGGITSDGSHIWVGGNDSRDIWKLNSGLSRLSTLTAPRDPENGWITKGLAWDGSNLWWCNFGAIVKLSPDGEELASYYLPNDDSIGAITWVDDHLWCCTRAESGGKLYKVAPNHPPSVTVSYTPKDATVGEEVEFSASVSDPDDDELDIEWRFEAGTEASGREATYAFDQTGQRLVNISVTDQHGASNGEGWRISVSEPEEEGGIGAAGPGFGAASALSGLLGAGYLLASGSGADESE